MPGVNDLEMYFLASPTTTSSTLGLLERPGPGDSDANHGVQTGARTNQSKISMVLIFYRSPYAITTHYIGLAKNTKCP